MPVTLHHVSEIDSPLDGRARIYPDIESSITYMGDIYNLRSDRLVGIIADTTIACGTLFSDMINGVVTVNIGDRMYASTVALSVEINKCVYRGEIDEFIAQLKHDLVMGDEFIDLYEQLPQSNNILVYWKHDYFDQSGRTRFARFIHKYAYTDVNEFCECKSYIRKDGIIRDMMEGITHNDIAMFLKNFITNTHYEYDRAIVMYTALDRDMVIYNHVEQVFKSRMKSARSC